MPKAQLENGYVRIANELLEAICKAGLNGVQTSILLVIIRYTYGYNRKTVKVSASFIANAINSKNRSNIAKELRKLIDYKIIDVVSSEPYKPKEYSVNKNYNEWKTTQKNNSECGTIVVQGSDVPLWHNSSTVCGTVVVQKCGTTVLQIKDNKDNIKTISSNSKKICDENIKKAIQLYEQNIAVPSPIAIELLRDILSSHSTDLLELAIHEAVKANAKSINYIEGIFRNWDNAGVKTVESAKLAIAEHKNKKQSATANKNKQNDNADDWGHDEI